MLPFAYQAQAQTAQQTTQDSQPLKEKVKLKEIWGVVKTAYDKLTGATKKFIPVAINVVEGIRKAMDSPVDDVVLTIVKTAIPGDADDKFIDKAKATIEQWLPKILIELKLVESIAEIEDKTNN